MYGLNVNFVEEILEVADVQVNTLTRYQLSSSNVSRMYKLLIEDRFVNDNQVYPMMVVRYPEGILAADCNHRVCAMRALYEAKFKNFLSNYSGTCLDVWINALDGNAMALEAVNELKNSQAGEDIYKIDVLKTMLNDSSSKYSALKYAAGEDYLIDESIQKYAEVKEKWAKATFLVAEAEDRKSAEMLVNKIGGWANNKHGAVETTLDVGKRIVAATIGQVSQGNFDVLNMTSKKLTEMFNVDAPINLHMRVARYQRAAKYLKEATKSLNVSFTGVLDKPYIAINPDLKPVRLATNNDFWDKHAELEGIRAEDIKYKASLWYLDIDNPKNDWTRTENNVLVLSMLGDEKVKLSIPLVGVWKNGGKSGKKVVDFFIASNTEIEAWHKELEEIHKLTMVKFEGEAKQESRKRDRSGSSEPATGTVSIPSPLNRYTGADNVEETDVVEPIVEVGQGLVKRIEEDAAYYRALIDGFKADAKELKEYYESKNQAEKLKVIKHLVDLLHQL